MNSEKYLLSITKKIGKSIVFEIEINDEQMSNIVVYLMENDKNPLPLIDKSEKQKTNQK